MTDHTPGFGSAAKYIGASTKEVIRDAQGLNYKKNTITIMEIMGRNAGWLTGATALAKTEDCDGPDLIYLPEVPFDTERFLKKVKELLKKKSSIVIAVTFCRKEIRKISRCSLKLLVSKGINIIPYITQFTYISAVLQFNSL